MAIAKGTAAQVADVVGIADDLRLILAKANDSVARYFDTGLSADVNALAQPGDPVPGTPIDKENMLAAITLLQQFQNFMNGQPVATAAYRVTVNRVAALKG